MKYMIMMFGGLGAAVQDRTPEWITGMHEMLVKLDGELRERGELVAGDKLIDPSRATTVRFANGAPVPTDGPFAEVKMFGGHRRTYVEDLINQAIAAVTAAEESIDWTTSVGKPALMSDNDYAQFQGWLITEGLKNWNLRVTEARLALARVVPYVPDVEDLLPFAPDGGHRGTHRRIIVLLREHRR